VSELPFGISEQTPTVNAGDANSAPYGAPAALDPSEPVESAPAESSDHDLNDDASQPTRGAETIVDEAPLSSQDRTKRTLWSSRISLLLVAALVGGLAGHYAAPSSSNGGITINANNSSPGGAVLPSGLTVPALVHNVEPSIVSIDVKGQGTEDQGTGMIINAKGYVITNNHVIAAAVNGGSITVTRVDQGYGGHAGRNESDR
jgi:putative serine protease PepD